MNDNGYVVRHPSFNQWYALSSHTHLTRPHQQTQPQWHATMVTRNQPHKQGWAHNEGRKQGRAATTIPHQWQTQAPNKATQMGPTNGSAQQGDMNEGKGKHEHPPPSPTNSGHEHPTRWHKRGRAPTNSEWEHAARQHEQGQARAWAPANGKCKHTPRQHKRGQVPITNPHQWWTPFTTSTRKRCPQNPPTTNTPTSSAHPQPTITPTNSNNSHLPPSIHGNNNPPTPPTHANGEHIPPPHHIHSDNAHHHTSPTVRMASNTPLPREPRNVVYFFLSYCCC